MLIEECAARGHGRDQLSQWLSCARRRLCHADFHTFRGLLTQLLDLKRARCAGGGAVAGILDALAVVLWRADFGPEEVRAAHHVFLASFAHSLPPSWAGAWQNSVREATPPSAGHGSSGCAAVSNSAFADPLCSVAASNASDDRVSGCAAASYTSAGRPSHCPVATPCRRRVVAADAVSVPAYPVTPSASTVIGDASASSASLGVSDLLAVLQARQKWRQSPEWRPRACESGGADFDATRPPPRGRKRPFVEVSPPGCRLRCGKLSVADGDALATERGAAEGAAALRRPPPRPRPRLRLCGRRSPEPSPQVAPRRRRDTGVCAALFRASMRGAELELVYVGAANLMCAFTHHHKKVFGPKKWLLARVSVDVGQHMSPGQKGDRAAQIAARLRDGVVLSDCIGFASERHGAAQDTQSEPRRLYLLVVKPRPNSKVITFCVAPPAEFCGDVQKALQKLWDPWWPGLKTIAREGKLLARAGLLFSGKAVGPSGFNICLQEDLKSEDGTVLTDGAGLISADLFEEAVDALRPRDWQRLRRFACVVQGRVIRVSPGVVVSKGIFLRDPKLPARTLVLRPSQVKAGEEAEGPCADPLFVNCIADAGDGQMGVMELLLREGAGVPANTLVNIVLQANRRVLEPSGATHERIAQRFVREGVAQFGKRPRLPIDPEWIAFHKMMYDIRDSCIDSYLTRAQAGRLQHCWKHTRMRTSAMFMALPDHTRTLKPGEVILKSRRFGEEGDEPKCYEGEVSIWRTPALHPGNLRRLLAVRPPEGSMLAQILEGRGEVAIFDAVGERTELDRMAGGDYDGDLVSASWDKQLLPPGPTVEPPSYAAPAVEPSTWTGTLNEVSVAVLKRGDGALVGTLHYCWEQLVGAGTAVMSQHACRRLEQLYNQAMDSIKTGARVDEAEVDALMREQLGDYRSFKWDFKSVGRPGQVKVRPSPTAVGYIARRFQALIDSAQAGPETPRECRDPRLRAAWQQLALGLKAEAMEDILAVYNAWRRKASAAWQQQKTPGTSRSKITVRVADADAEEAVAIEGRKAQEVSASDDELFDSDSDKAESSDAHVSVQPRGPWERYLVAFRAAFLAVCKRHGVQPRRAALLVYEKAELSGSLPWSVVGDFLVETLRKEAHKRGEGPRTLHIPIEKMWLLMDKIA